MSEKNDILNKLMTYDFAADELKLFLDTHPEDIKALEMHKAVCEKAEELTKEYNEKYAPLTANSNLSGKEWIWINSPWPWENQKG